MENQFVVPAVIDNTLTITMYFIYLPIALGMTFLVARVLFKNSKIFMLDIFHGRTEIAYATNRLFEIGFYLLNVGAALLILRTYHIDNYQQMIEVLSSKIGGFSIYLGIILFLNLLLFFRGRKKSNQHIQNAI